MNREINMIVVDKDSLVYDQIYMIYRRSTYHDSIRFIKYAGICSETLLQYELSRSVPQKSNRPKHTELIFKLTKREIRKHIITKVICDLI